MTFFGEANPKFLPIPEDKRIVTSSFLEASDVMVPFFDNFGAVFKPVKNDVTGNIRKIRAQFERNPEKYKTVTDILEETGAKGDKVLTDAHIGVVWLTRGLDFIQKMLELIVQDYEGGTYDGDGKMKDLVKQAYADTLSHHHNLIMRGVFNTVCMGAPYKKDFMEKLKTKPDVTIDQVIADMKEYHRLLAETAVAIQETITALGVKG